METMAGTPIEVLPLSWPITIRSASEPGQRMAERLTAKSPIAKVIRQQMFRLITPMEWTYEPGKPVEIAFDVTSFRKVPTANRSIPSASALPVCHRRPHVGIGNQYGTR